MLRTLRDRQPGAPLYALLLHVIGKIACQLICLFFFRARAFGQRNVPVHGPLLIVSNHQSYLDPPLIGGFLGPRHTDWVARAGLFKLGPIGRILVSVGAAPIEEDGRSATGIRIFMERLAMGRCVVVFPEGSRTEDGRIGAFKRGVALMVKKANCPVLPAAVEGCFDAWPRGGKPRIGRRIAVMYGEPIMPAELMKDGAGAALERLEREIESLRSQLHARLRESTHGAFPPERAPKAGDVQNGHTNAA